MSAVEEKVEEKIEEKSQNNFELPKDIVDDIDAAIDLSITEDKEEPAEEPEEKAEEEIKEDKTPEEDNKVSEEIEDEDEEDEEDSEEEEIEAEDDKVSDELLEKAITLGVPIDEARKLGAELLNARISRLEKSAGAAGEDVDGDISQQSDADIVDGIPDLDPELYEPELVDGFKAMKQIIKSQADIINGLQGDLRQTSDTSVFDAHVTSLGEGINKILSEDPGKRSALKEKVDILTAGYEAVGKDVDYNEVFKEAADVMLAEDMAKLAEEAKGTKIKKRKKQAISRAGGTRGSQERDVFEEVGDELDRKFFDKK